ncbi:hypothetical protein HSR121_2890 [Halapricum desulfuricans]|uniref:Uncharacterized protein n=1 Tax=Halapricum desulfuricans TaxID=2841257 RepID=A0A897N4P5_9EURY|nr:hypothetical protein HSR121_2890 [Halapricum desulfuricans]
MSHSLRRPPFQRLLRPVSRRASIVSETPKTRFARFRASDTPSRRSVVSETVRQRSCRRPPTFPR